MKRVFIIHGWGSNPERARLQWLKKELSNVLVSLLKMAGKNI